MRQPCSTSARISAALRAAVLIAAAGPAVILTGCASEADPAAPQALPAAEEQPMLVEDFFPPVVLFDTGSTELTAAGRVAVQDAVAHADLEPEGSIRLTAHTDTVGPPAANLRLSQARAETVRDALVAAGVSPERITIEARGETDTAVPTGDEVRNQANRRVVITIM